MIAMISRDVELESTSTTLSRSAANGIHDSTQAFENLVSGAFTDWPNEAGFENLTEERGPFNLSVTGYIPPWVAGTLYRTGPGVYSVDLPNSPNPFRIKHWFDGLGHTHRFEIVPSSGDPKDQSCAQVFYSSRRQCDDFVASLQDGGTRFFSFAQRTDPCVGLYGKFASFFEKRNSSKTCQVTINPNIPVYNDTLGHPPVRDSVTGHHANVKSLWLATDSTPMIQVDPVTLEPSKTHVNMATLDPNFVGHLSSSHWGVDNRTGEYFNYSLRFGPVPEYTVYCLAPGATKPRILAKIQECGAAAAYIHSTFLTPSYFILCIPSTHLAAGGLKMLWNQNVHETIKPFDRNTTTRWFVIDRLHNRGLLARFETPAGFFFHSTNAYEKNGKVYCEMLEYPDTTIIDAFYCDVILNRDGAASDFWKRAAANAASDGTPPPPRESLRRYELDMEAALCIPASSGTLGPSPRVVSDIPGPHVGELPTINPLYALNEHRYVYSTVNRGLSTMFDAVAKADTKDGGALLWCPDKGHTPGEPIFVPRPGAVSEDDGVLLSIVLDGEGRKSYMVCLNARDMTEIGRADCDFAIGIGFHGVHAQAKYR